MRGSSLSRRADRREKSAHWTTLRQTAARGLTADRWQEAALPLGKDEGRPGELDEEGGCRIEEGDKIEVTCGLVSGQRAPISGQRPATFSGCRDLYVWIYSLLLRHQQKLYYGKK
jgi:hypothetical protein